MQTWITRRSTAPEQPSFTPPHAGVVQRRCACGGVAGPEGECAECRRKRLAGQPVSSQSESVPSRVHEVLREPGRHLDETTRATMEPAAGRDLRDVRIHTGDRAAESATAIQAQAYTVGRHIVFGPRQYAPGSPEGRRLLAHELTHVSQQGATGSAVPSRLRLGAPDTAHERQAARGERTVEAEASGAPPGLVQRQPSHPSAPSPTSQLNLTIGEDGKVSVTVAGPEAPVIGNPTIGIRRGTDGKYDLLVGGKDKTVAAGEIPGMLRGALGDPSKSRPGATIEGFTVPTCTQLRSSKDGRFFTFDEYRANQMIAGRYTPLSPAFYDALIENCRPKPLEIDVPPAAPPQEAVPPVSPPGTAVA